MTTQKAAARLDIISDVVCPWCYIGKHRLTKALEILNGEIDLHIEWKPYQLNPNTPLGGTARDIHYTSKFGSPQAAAQLIANVTANAHHDGLAMDYGKIERVPNTLAAHRLIRFAARFDCQDAVVDALFSAYFVAGKNIEDAAVLTAIGLECGIEGEVLETFLNSDEGLEIVKQEAKAAQQSGVQGVPAFSFNGRTLFSGAQSPETIALSLKRAVARGL